MVWLLLFFLILILVVSWSTCWSMLRGAPYVPTTKKAISHILELSKPKKGQIFYDLGSGDGRILIAAAKITGCYGVGIETSLLRVWLSRYLVRKAGLKGKIKIFRKNVFKANLSRADIICLFLWQKTNNMLAEKLIKETKPDTIFVSNVFKLPKEKFKLVKQKEAVFLYKKG